MLANHGRTDKYIHEIEGVNSRLDTLQAAILRAKLPHLDEWNRARREHAEAYCRALCETPVTLPSIDSRSESVWHLFVIRVGSREALAQRLKDQGIATGIHYPLPLHKQPAFDHLSQRRPLPVTEQIAGEILTLPANIPHAVRAVTRFKMLLVMIKRDGAPGL